MSRNLTMARAILLAALVLLIAGTTAFRAVPALAGNGQPSKVYNSKKVTVYYDNEKQIQELRQKIKPKSLTRSLNKLFSGSDSGTKENLGQFLDILFERVQTILEMPMPKQKVNIWIHPSIKHLGKFFQANYGGPTAKQTSMGASVTGPAFYVKKTNTIHIQVEDMRIGILAHEMAHSITENYFIIRPPTNVAEIMSQHVDREVSQGRF